MDQTVTQCLINGGANQLNSTFGEINTASVAPNVNPIQVTVKSNNTTGTNFFTKKNKDNASPSSATYTFQNEIIHEEFMPERISLSKLLNASKA